MALSRKEFIEKYKEDRPAAAHFAECISRAYMTGVAFFGIGAVSFHLAQLAFKERLPYSPQIRLALTLFFGTGVAYQVGAKGMKECQAAFMEEEGRKSPPTSGALEDLSDL
ncbi:unnamed protein product [Bemisia tabaci]|uniref:Uncharacterized protein n=1 Tax=Bemisia tabaci TaxID=7038 RepID=A0A9P0EW34_BEMTA|nr:PREDICTED: uncharacterized protein LOC109038827 [Bemisia tabaci]CAH0381563.1 unnamed protein product [Bemisia tabaci]